MKLSKGPYKSFQTKNIDNEEYSGRFGFYPMEGGFMDEWVYKAKVGRNDILSDGKIIYHKDQKQPQ